MNRPRFMSGGGCGGGVAPTKKKTPETNMFHQGGRRNGRESGFLSDLVRREVGPGTGGRISRRAKEDRRP